MGPRVKWALIVAALLLIPSGCGDSDVTGAVTGARRVSIREEISLPSQILGLTVKAEDISQQLASTKRPYIDTVGLFSLREADLVRATFQVSHFNPLARPDDEDFRNEIIGQLGGTQPVTVRVEDMTVYALSGSEQQVFVWFSGEGFYVLTAHQQYEFPRLLLRKFVEMGEI